jgi:[protein-PII] uridylyltransferase
VPLFVAMLLHDVGKGEGGEGHSERGADQSVGICERLGLSPEDIDEARWLISAHLTMYHLATRRDIDDPQTVAQFAHALMATAGSPLERLQHLYVLTFSDISTTSPTAMNEWKARMLDDLFLATENYLTSGGSRTADSAVMRIADPCATEFKKLGGKVPFLLEFMDSMPKDYMIGQGAHAVAAHARVAETRALGEAGVAVVPGRHRDAIELCVVADDRPGLLALFAAALAANRFDILTARIYSRSTASGGREAVDFFCVRRTMREGAEAIEPPVARELARLRDDLMLLLSQKTSAVELLRSRRGGGPMKERPSPAIATQVEIDDRASREYTVVDVYAKDRPALLFTVANALHSLGLSIGRSKVGTEGNRAADSFYVVEKDSSKVSSSHRREAIRRTVSDAIEHLAEHGV